MGFQGWGFRREEGRKGKKGRKGKQTEEWAGRRKGRNLHFCKQMAATAIQGQGDCSGSIRG